MIKHLLLIIIFAVGLNVVVHKLNLPLGTGIETSSSDTVLYVYPTKKYITTSSSFLIDINVENVTDLYGFEFKLSYDTTILDATNITEGPFLKSGGPTFIAKMEINETTGTIWVAITLYEVEKGVDGSGTLVTITFEATALGDSPLHLYDTILGDSYGNPIPHSTKDGIVYVETSESIGGLGYNSRMRLFR